MKTKILITLFALIVSGTIAFSQDTTKIVKKQTVTTNLQMQKDSVYYTCTMHPNVKLNQPGKCPECGMDLVKKSVNTETSVKKSEGLVTYTCPMHSEVTSDKAGKCPKCGMDLVVKK